MRTIPIFLLSGYFSYKIDPANFDFSLLRGIYTRHDERKEHWLAIPDTEETCGKWAKVITCPDGEAVKIAAFESWNAKEGVCGLNTDLDKHVRESCREYECIHDYYSWADGCSAGLLSAIYDKLFEPICNIHDLCYIMPVSQA